MIHFKKLIYLMILLTFGCSANQTSDNLVENNIDSTQKETFEINATNADSLYDPRNYYYLSFLPTKTFAELILSDSIYPNDYKMIYCCLDSLCSKNKLTRDYYFIVLHKILDNMEIVLHQQMGQYLINNIDEYKSEFLDRLTKMTNEQIKFYAQGIESALNQKWLADIQNINNNANESQRKKMNLFLKEIEMSANDSMQ